MTNESIYRTSLLSLSLICLTFLSSCEKDKTPDGPETVGRPVTENSSKWISQVLEYAPAPGQFMNVAWSLPENVEALVGGKAATGVTLGTFGGSVTFTFDHSVQNQEGTDFVIHGNAFGTSHEPAAVMVAFDKNVNVKPDDEEWYELKGERYDDPKTIKGYRITYKKPEDTTVKAPIEWTDNQQGSGEFPTGFYNRSYWPCMLEGDELTYTGNKIDVEDGNLALTGYADVFTSDYDTSVNEDPDTAKSNKFDISDAVDANGDPANLQAIDFIRVYNPIYKIAGMLGEVSPEICGAISLSVK